MPKRTFEIEWPDDCGPLWMNRDNLLICLTETCPNTEFTVRDTTGDGASDARPRTDGPANPYRDNRDRQNILEAVARGWCHEKNGTKVMDPDLADAIVSEVFAATR